MSDHSTLPHQYLRHMNVAVRCRQHILSHRDAAVGSVTPVVKVSSMSVQDPMPSLPIALPVALTIRHSRDLAEILRSAFENSGDILIDIPEAGDVDLSFIQLIEACRRSADRLGRTFALCRPADGNVLSTLSRGGFLTGMTSVDEQFWLHGKELVQ